MADKVLGEGRVLRDLGGGQYAEVVVLDADSLAALETITATVDTTALETKTGAVTETAPATDTASSGLNGRLQRIAQRVTSLIALLPAALGQGTMAQSLTATIASDQTPVPTASKVVVVTATPTLDTSAYVSGDSLHTAVLTFANAVRVTGGSGYIEKLLILDKIVQSQPGELWLFSATVTPAAANAAHSISDADAALCVGVIPFGSYYASALNSVSVAKGLNIAFTVAATSLFGILVTRGTPTYGVGDLVVTLVIAHN